MQTFIYYHPKLYVRLLSFGLVVMLISGLTATWRIQSRASDQLKGLARWEKYAIEIEDRVSPPSTAKAAADVKAEAKIATVKAKLPPYDGVGPTGDPVELAKSMNAVWFGEEHWPALHSLWANESGWNPEARNSSSGACGIPQALPCSKISDQSTPGQIEWGLNYIQRRYANPTQAWSHWESHDWY